MDPFGKTKNYFFNDHFYTVDTFTLLDNAMADPGAYGFKDINDMFWVDGLHPSTKGHSLLANTVMAELTPAPTPEPSTFILLFIGVGAFFGLKKKSRS